MDDRVYPTFEDDSPAVGSSVMPLVQLEIVRGRAAHRFRRVAPPVFMIGSAADCDLVLADATFPEVHTYLYVTERGVTTRRLGEGPLLKIDGRVSEGGAVRDGGRIEIGEFAFDVHIERPIRIPDDGEPLRGPHWGPRATRASFAQSARGEAEVKALLADIRAAIRVEAGLKFFESEGPWRTVTADAPLVVRRAS